MELKNKDLGLGNDHASNQQRAINKEGSFNVRKIGAVKGIRDLYQHLVTMSWPKFFLLVVCTYFVLNFLFAAIYYLIGIEYLSGLQGKGFVEEFLGCFYFSTQTFTTVGYGAVAPVGIATNLVASFEAMIGLLSFALATGLLFGRFSKPNAKFLFSEKVLISPYKADHPGLMFRVVNKRDSVLLETSAEVILTYYYKGENGEEKRGYKRLELEISDIKMFPTTWTIVHPITADSPFYEMDDEKLKTFRFELLVMIKAFDETFGQHVYARTSFTEKELVYKAKFGKPFHINKLGQTEVDLNTIGDYTIVDSLT